MFQIIVAATDMRIYQMVSSALIALNTLTVIIIVLSVVCAVRKCKPGAR